MKELKTPIQIAKEVEWKAVRKALRFYYGGKWDTKEKVFKKIKSTRRKAHHDKEEFLKITCYEYYSIATNKYSMSFRKWNELSNIPFSEEAMCHYDNASLLAHFIYEITWYGSEARAQGIAKRLFKKKSKIIRDIEK